MSFDNGQKKGVSDPSVSTHKFFVPCTNRESIPRVRALERIFVEDGVRVTLVQGPAGHGKSTLMQQAKTVCESNGNLTGWLTLDEADNDISRFFTHLQALLVSIEQMSQPGESTGAEDEVGTRISPRSDWFINRLLQLGRPVALFFDEFQTLNNGSVQGFFQNVLKHLPDKVTIFIGSRTLPEIGLARLVVNNQALMLRPEDLRFSREEVARFFADAAELDISEDEIEAIYEKTEGWPAALQLYRLSLASPSVRQSLTDIGAFRPRQLAEYLADNVLALQEPRVQKFLLRTSLLTRLSAPLCDAVMEWDESQSVLEELERCGLFLRNLDTEMQWFKYHSVFSSFLAEQLRAQEPGRVPRIHNRAARWYRDKSFHEDAMHHAIAVRDYAFATRVLDEWASKLVMDADLMTVERWYDRLPLNEIEKYPDLVIKVAYALAFLRRRQKLGPISELLERQAASDDPEVSEKPSVVRSMIRIIQDDADGASELVETVDVTNPDATEFRAFELGAAANLRGYLAATINDFEGARQYLNLGKAHSDQGDASFSGGYAVGTAGMNLMIEGRLNEAIERFRQGMEEPRLSMDETVASAALVSCYIHALYEADRLETAAEHFSHFRDIIYNAAMHDYLVVAYIAMSRIHDQRGDETRAAELLDEAEAAGYLSMWPRIVRNVNWERIRRALLKGEVDRAHSIASRIAREVDGCGEGRIRFSEDTEGDLIGKIRIAIHDGRAEEALKLLATELTRASRGGRVRRQLKLQILEALAHRQAGAENAAHRSLLKALQLAKGEPFVRSFLDEGYQIVELLRENYQSVAETQAVLTPEAQETCEVVERLLNAAGEDLAHREEPLDLAFEPLTDREKEILLMLANGVSNKEIANRVFVSENTVKFHLKNIYSKLGVSNRLQALSVAREKRLLLD